MGLACGTQKNIFFHPQLLTIPQFLLKYKMIYLFLPIFVLIAISYWLYLFMQLFVVKLTFSETFIGIGFLAIQLLGLLLLLVYISELLIAIKYYKNYTFKQHGFPKHPPFVSIHVPIRSEPVKMVKATLKSLSRLEYPLYEVLVIYNNTTEKELWQPIKLYCAELTKSSCIQFRFFYIKRLPGFKAGALNYALKQMDSKAELVAVIDADFIVETNFLQEIIPHFKDKNIGYVQTPQDYRFNENRIFDCWCYFSYKYFFDICMTARNSRNSILFVGTMGIIKKEALISVGKWDEKCITEDAEFAFRIAQKGYKAIFVNKTYGWGLMPFTFSDFKSQRYRWAFGGMQILRKHIPKLWMPQRYKDSSKLTITQRYDYSTCIIQWLDALIALVNILLLILSCIIYLSKLNFTFRPIITAIAAIPIMITYCRIIFFSLVFKKLINCKWSNALGAIITLMSLSWVVAWACIRGLTSKKGVFNRTSKFTARNPNLQILLSTIPETTISILSITLALLMIFLHHHNISAFILGVLLISQTINYITAPFIALLSLAKFK